MIGGLGKESFIATGSVIAVFIDVTRLTVYSKHFAASGFQANLPQIGAATVSAFTGAYLGSKLLKKITLETVHLIVAILLVLVGLALTFGII